MILKEKTLKLALALDRAIG